MNLKVEAFRLTRLQIGLPRNEWHPWDDSSQSSILSGSVAKG